MTVAKKKQQTARKLNETAAKMTELKKNIPWQELYLIV
jgi:hypothetical protein